MKLDELPSIIREQGGAENLAMLAAIHNALRHRVAQIVADAINAELPQPLCNPDRDIFGKGILRALGGNLEGNEVPEIVVPLIDTEFSAKDLRGNIGRLASGKEVGNLTITGVLEANRLSVGGPALVISIQVKNATEGMAAVG